MQYRSGPVPDLITQPILLLPSSEHRITSVILSLYILHIWKVAACFSKRWGQDFGFDG